ncbi:MAG: hypothetical protein NTZ19_01460 [Bacteroidetes bacterium]|nr:hypothetical protein [Bacteroidota bacterium]
MKKVSIIAIIVFCISLSYFFPHAMLNPGELVQGHQELNKKCLSCHTAFSGISNEKCISCHKLSEVDKVFLKGMDSSSNKAKIMFHQQLLNQECSSCHTDHKGIKPGMLISRFKHELLSVNILTNCSSCHSKPVDTLHKLLSVNCGSCHNSSSWKLKGNFNHEMIQGVDKINCTACHNKPTDTYHQLLTTGCNKCHSTSKWVPSTFDHSKYFMLDEKHNVTCNTCHTNNNFVIYTCYSCHEHSEKNTISKHNEEGIYNITNCASCHKSGKEHDKDDD